MVKIKNLEDVFRYLPIKGEVAFASARGRFQEKVKKQQLKVMRDFVEDLQHVLEQGEEILLATRAASPFTFLEQLTTGLWIYHIKRCLLVLTNRRLLHFPADYKFKPRQSVAQIRFNDISTFKGKRHVTFRFKNGVKETFYQVRNGKRLVHLLKGLAGSISTSTSHGGRQHLCPRCVAPLPRDRYTCPRCRLEFKEPGAAKLYSIFLPGGGYFYTRHPWLGIGDAVTELFLMFITLLFLLKYFTQAGEPSQTLYVGVFAGMILFLEKLITVYHAKHFIREYIPVEKRFNRIPQSEKASKRVVRDSSELYMDEGDERVRFL